MARAHEQWHVAAAEAIEAARSRASLPYEVVARHGTLEVGMYAPTGHDPQSPHDRDEVYVVAAGSGTFVRGDERVPFEPGHMLFVPAGMEHRFEDFSDDFAVWVMFYGPSGGEQPVAD